MLPLEQVLHHRWDADKLVRAHPPRRLPSRKRDVHTLSCPPGRPPRGTVEVFRYSAGSLPARVTPAATHIAITEDWFRYAPPEDPAVTEWHVNFASSVAFATYALPLFAQDEMQVLEHPALMSVYEALAAEGTVPCTVERNVPTPVLARGVERRCAIDTAPTAGRPRGLYGNEFEIAPREAVLAATRVLDPPTVSHILAIEAPAYGFGAYQPGEIAFILRTAWAGFAGTLEAQSRRHPRVTVHTGYWGCGAYGGNRVLMTLLQCVAARAAGIERLVIHAGRDAQDARTGAETATRILGNAGTTISTPGLIEQVAALGLAWGIGNGT